MIERVHPPRRFGRQAWAVGLLTGSLLLGGCSDGDRVEASSTTSTTRATTSTTTPEMVATTTTQPERHDLTSCFVDVAMDQLHLQSALPNKQPLPVALGVTYLRNETRRGVAGVTEVINPLVTDCLLEDGRSIYVLSALGFLGTSAVQSWPKESVGLTQKGPLQLVDHDSAQVREGYLFADPAQVPGLAGANRSLPDPFTTSLLVTVDSAPLRVQDPSIPSHDQHGLIAQDAGGSSIEIARATFHPSVSASTMASLYDLSDQTKLIGA